MLKRSKKLWPITALREGDRLLTDPSDWLAPLAAVYNQRWGESEFKYIRELEELLERASIRRLQDGDQVPETKAVGRITVDAGSSAPLQQGLQQQIVQLLTVLTNMLQAHLGQGA